MSLIQKLTLWMGLVLLAPPVGAVDLVSGVLEGRRLSYLTCEVVNESEGAVDVGIEMEQPNVGPLLGPVSCPQLPSGQSCSLRYTISYPQNLVKAFCRVGAPEGAFVRGNLRLQDNNGVTLAQSGLEADPASQLTDFAALGGVLEISQSCAAVGCFPGDGPGFPVTITEGGSYRLTSNLVNSGGLGGIEVTGEDASLDLNGFRMQLSEDPQSGVQIGIDVLGRNARVRNGTVRGFGIGVLLRADGGTLTDLSVLSNGDGISIFGSGGHRVEGCTVSDGDTSLGDGDGIILQAAKALFIDNIVENNDDGLRGALGHQASLRSNVFRDNAGDDLLALYVSLGPNQCGDTLCP